MFARSEPTLKSSAALQPALIHEFAYISSPAQIHEMLATRTCKTNEIMSAYLLLMKGIAQRAIIDDASIMHYVINGTHNSANNKAILFTATFIINCNINSKSIKKFVTKVLTINNKKRYIHVINKYLETENSPKIFCYRCAQPGQLMKVCVHKTEVIKLFSRNKFDHKFNKRTKTICRTVSNRKPIPKFRIVESEKSHQNMAKLVKMADIEIDVLIDAGRHIAVIKQDLYGLLSSRSLLFHFFFVLHIFFLHIVLVYLKS